MIRIDGVPSILESLYLGEPLTSSLRDISIEVNPVNLKFMSGKTVIINSREWSLPTDQGYNNTLISRILGIPGARYVPYLPRVLSGVMWNGMTVGSPEEALDCYFYDSGILYFPKISGYSETGTDLDWLGYLEYQVGYNFYDSPIRDLDILKCRKGLKSLSMNSGSLTKGDPENN